MRIPTQLRQTLIGTTVVGAFFGVLCALGSFAFYSEYGPRIAGAPHDAWAKTFHAIGIFFWVTVGIVGAFGLLPSAISFALSRLFRKASNISSKRTREKPRAA
ncbi:hypothetical protein EAH88_02130 [Rhodanobacter glycinis]|uniref:Uncharacterized protein n=1 Tax=Rhodanobacter glycinis TaxID=582702 RepID=A0A502CDW5_9GAMM|nr:hypothetical protein [Rhodanobacter glycinis]TPG11357.1 hypothetical protein EAH88_02130 [Rhodanobacter glycinis]